MKYLMKTDQITLGSERAKDVSTIARRTAKRTVCWHEEGSTNIQYFRVPYGRELGDVEQRELAAEIHQRSPGATVYGARGRL